MNAWLRGEPITQTPLVGFSGSFCLLTIVYFSSNLKDKTNSQQKKEEEIPIKGKKPSIHAASSMRFLYTTLGALYKLTCLPQNVYDTFPPTLFCFIGRLKSNPMRSEKLCTPIFLPIVDGSLNAKMPELRYNSNK
jgi:hypothetical protein